jgi:hypothetical protein
VVEEPSSTTMRGRPSYGGGNRRGGSSGGGERGRGGGFRGSGGVAESGGREASLARGEAEDVAEGHILKSLMRCNMSFF